MKAGKAIQDALSQEKARFFGFFQLFLDKTVHFGPEAVGGKTQGFRYHRDEGDFHA
jgi:hypothetical protein